MGVVAHGRWLLSCQGKCGDADPITLDYEKFGHGLSERILSICFTRSSVRENSPNTRMGVSNLLSNYFSEQGGRGRDRRGSR
jgi:hypothetical protein